MVGQQSDHSVEINGPFPNGDRFIIHFQYDVTTKPTGKRMTMNEMGLYTVENDKIVKEEFFLRHGVGTIRREIQV